MTHQQLKKKTEGFTIIEVLIVLAIAGLIMLIVFLAVPNLQRNNRNTQRTATAAAILGGMSEFQGNNNGAAITGLAFPGNSVTISGAGGTAPVTIGRGAGFTTITWGGVRPAAPPTPNADTLIFYTNATCNGAVTAAGTSTRQIVAFYGIENTGTRCTQI